MRPLLARYGPSGTTFERPGSVWLYSGECSFTSSFATAGTVVSVVLPSQDLRGLGHELHSTFADLGQGGPLRGPSELFLGSIIRNTGSIPLVAAHFMEALVREMVQAIRLQDSGVLLTRGILHSSLFDQAMDHITAHPGDRSLTP